MSVLQKSEKALELYEIHLQQFKLLLKFRTFRKLDFLKIQIKNKFCHSNYYDTVSNNYFVHVVACRVTLHSFFSCDYW